LNVRRRSASCPVSSLQIALLRVLWRRGEATVQEVHEEVQEERRVALTTVATTLARLAKKGVVAHRTEGRTLHYRALLAEGEARRSALADVADRLFQGDVTLLVSQLLDAKEVDAESLRRIEDMIERKKREARRGR
jgi:predicted transcriptional regulator